MSDKKISRRRFIKAGAATGIGASAISPKSTLADDYPDDVLGDFKPEHVKISYDEQVLKAYQPCLNTSSIDLKPEATFSAYYQSPEYETDVAVYIHYYPTQKGFTSYDSHVVDREPVLVFIDSDTGELDKISYSAWHYLIAEESDPPTRNDIRPKITVESPHNHHYIDRSKIHKYTPKIDNFKEVIQPWYDNNWSADPSIMTEPWLANDTDSFWNNSSDQIGPINYNWNDERARIALLLVKLNPLRDVNTDIEI